MIARLHNYFHPADSGLRRIELKTDLTTLTENTLWKPMALIFAALGAVSLLLSWLLEPTRNLWLQLDNRVFWAMNNSLAWGKAWQWLWAVANNRAFDLVAAAAMLSLFASQVMGGKRNDLHRLLSILLLTVITAIFAVQIGKAIPVERSSPTVDYQNVLLLSELIPQIVTKDTATDSFPGDHGLVLFIVAGFVIFYLPRFQAVLACCFAIIFTLPRLMGGAHWLTDEIVGAVSITLLVLSCFFATPLHKKSVEGMQTMISAIERILRLKWAK